MRLAAPAPKFGPNVVLPPARIYTPDRLKIIDLPFLIVIGEISNMLRTY